ncbi:MAG: hypothetical protein B7Y41_13325 [Hydrogenophilales bacterium 28-61-23]|nr:MAG: hypothetical protein B7Y41_13325 [Hydrogenophilales bacterium 28-61-23]
MKTHLSHWALGTLLWLATIYPVLADSIIVGNVPRITVKQVEIDGVSYPLLKGDSQNMRATSETATECWSKYRTTCGTLAGIGYIDKASVTIQNGIAIRVEVLELKQ